MQIYATKLDFFDKKKEFLGYPEKIYGGEKSEMSKKDKGAVWDFIEEKKGVILFEWWKGEEEKGEKLLGFYSEP